ncbi:MAG: RNA polymerase sigma factor [Pseudomonadota bacterium]
MSISPDEFKSDLIRLLPRLKRFAMSLTRSAADADDLLQEACTTALHKWQQYDPSQPFDRWMFRVVRNLWVSEVRKRQVRQGQGQVPAEDALELHVEDTTEEALTAQVVRSKVDGLPKELSQPLMMVCSEGYSYRETSELLDVPIGTIMSRIHRARKLLTAVLAETEYAAK